MRRQRGPANESGASPLPRLRRAAYDGHHVLHRTLGVAARYCRRETARQMRLQSHHRHLANCGGDGVELLQDVEAVAIVDDHLLNAADLPFELPEPQEYVFPWPCATR